jgi:hypothetical protein
LLHELGVKCAIWNAEVPGAEDYDDPTMARVRDLLRAQEQNAGCLSRFVTKAGRVLKHA